MANDSKALAEIKSRNAQPACSACIALGALPIKERNGFSDEDVARHLVMNPCFQYFVGRAKYQYKALLDASA